MIIICNTTVVTCDDENRILTDAALLIDEGRILAVGPAAEFGGHSQNAEVVDGAGKVVFPGFANTHTHYSLIIAKGLFEDLSPPNDPPFSGGLSPIPVPDLSPDEMRTMVRLAALEAVKSGTTAVLEDGCDIATYAEELASTGLRYLLCERVWDRGGTSIGDPGDFVADPGVGEAGIDRFNGLRRDWHGARNGRIEVGLAAWAPDMCTPDLLKRPRALQDETGCISTIHLNQIWGEVAAVEAHRGRLPTEYLDDLGYLNDRVICAHCRCMVEREEAVLGAAHASVAFNSAIAARRGLSPRVHELEAAGCLIAMGSDNMSEDMVEVMRTGLFMERVRRRNGRAPTPEEALRWATSNGYRAMGIVDGGAIVKGNRADLILVDMQRAHLVPHLRPVSTFVHQGQAQDVISVMVDGRWVMRDGHVLTIDETATIREAQAVTERAWRRLYKTYPDLDPPAGYAQRMRS